MLENQVKEKYVMIAKLNQELDELNARKSGLVREINIELIVAKEKADKIIAEAEAKSKEIIKEANKIHDETKLHSEAIRNEADSLFIMAQNVGTQAREDREKLEKDMDDFEALKKAHNDEYVAFNINKNIVAEEAGDRQEELDNKETELRIKGLDVERREGQVVTAEEAQKNESDRLIALKNELIALENEINSQKANINSEKEENTKVLAEIKGLLSELKEVGLANKKDAEDNARERAKIAEDKKTINAQFDLIEKNQKDQEESAITLRERIQLADIKDAEIVQKIKILTELRAKNGLV